MSAMPDGRYDVFIVDAEKVDDQTMRVELAMVTGDDKGNVFAIRGPLLDDDPVMILGLPATLVVTDGIPRLEVDR